MRADLVAGAARARRWAWPRHPHALLRAAGTDTQRLAKVVASRRRRRRRRKSCRASDGFIVPARSIIRSLATVGFVRSARLGSFVCRCRRRDTRARIGALACRPAPNKRRARVMKLACEASAAASLRPETRAEQLPTLAGNFRARAPPFRSQTNGRAAAPAAGANSRSDSMRGAAPACAKAEAPLSRFMRAREHYKQISRPHLPPDARGSSRDPSGPLALCCPSARPSVCH